MVHTPAPNAKRARLLTLVALSALAALSSCGKPEEKATTEATTAATEIAWRHGDVADAFAEAAEQGKPVLLYWGAVWCPPCNRLKAGLFKDPAFIARTRDFVPVYLDGDSPGAQIWGERFGIKGYPTLIVLRPDRTEITRISGSGDGEQVAAVLAAVHKGSANTDELLRRVNSDPKSLTAADWTQLAGYGGWQDDARAGDKTATLVKLSQAAPSPQLQRQFALQALAQRSEEPGKPPLPASQAKSALEAVLASPEEVRANRSTLSYGAAQLVEAAAPAGPERQRLATQLGGVLDGIYADESLGISDRLSTAGAEIALQRAVAGKDAPLPPALVQKVHQRVEWADKAATDPYERQSLISTGAQLLARAGDAKGAEKLLEAELQKSQSPYYYMPSLAGLAEKRGDKKAAVEWLRKGYETSEGPASRVQWGVTYVEGLLRLAPENGAAIEEATAKVIGELASQPEGYRQRTRQRLEGLGAKLTQWSAEHDGAKTLERLRTRTNDACAAQADNAVLNACRNWLKTA